MNNNQHNQLTWILLGLLIYIIFVLLNTQQTLHIYILLNLLTTVYPDTHTHTQIHTQTYTHTHKLVYILHNFICITNISYSFTYYLLLFIHIPLHTIYFFLFTFLSIQFTSFYSHSFPYYLLLFIHIPFDTIYFFYSTFLMFPEIFFYILARFPKNIR